MRRVLLLVLAVGTATVSADPCSSAEAQESCGQCIKADVSCAWCEDPHAKVSQRCAAKTSFGETCNPRYIYAPTTELKIGAHELALESKNERGQIVQLEPQQAVLRMKVGDTLTVPFKYLHKTPASGNLVDKFAIQTSPYENKGVELQFLIQCNGEEIEAAQCPDLKDGQTVEFKIKVTMKECSQHGTIAISIGVYGYTTVSALYITSLCGCECEKLNQQRKNSPLCSNHGDLICGQCICESSRGGDKCECPLASFNVKNAAELDNMCRASPDGAICNGKGTCKCGQCQCNSPTISGKMCECDNDSCPRGENGAVCSANGVCGCGKCTCERGWDREDCSCTTDPATCIESGIECSQNGHCECGKCVCNVGFTGAFCGSVDEMVKPTEKEVAEEPEPTEEEEEAPTEEPAAPEETATEAPSEDSVDVPPAPGAEAVSASTARSLGLVFVALIFTIFVR